MSENIAYFSFSGLFEVAMIISLDFSSILFNTSSKLFLTIKFVFKFALSAIYCQKSKANPYSFPFSEKIIGAHLS